MSLRLSGLNPGSYLGVEPLQPPNFTPVHRAPTFKDYQNFNIGSLWLNTAPTSPTASDIYMLVSKAAGVSKWVNFGSGFASVVTLTGNTGGAVGIDGADNINVVGDGLTIEVAGNPGTHTLTISTGTEVAVVYDEDTGSAIALGGILNVIGGTGIVTSGSGNTITIATS